MFLNPEKIKKDIIQMDKIKSSVGSRFNFNYLSKGTSFVGMIVLPKDENGEPMDFYSIDNVHRFGKTYIPQNENNDSILQKLDVGETASLSKQLDDFTKSYSLISNLKFALIDPRDKNNPLKVIIISYSSKVSEFLSKFYEVYNTVKDTVFNRLLKITMNKSGTIEISVSDKKDFTWETISKELIGEGQEEQISQNLGKLFKTSKKYEESELTSIVMKWKREVDRELGISSTPSVSSENITTSGWDDFIKERSQSQIEDDTPNKVDLFGEDSDDLDNSDESDELDSIWGDFDNPSTTKYERSPF